MTDRVEQNEDRPHPEPVQVMTSGGDARILLSSPRGLNRYHSAPFPRAMLAYASSTANDISVGAFAEVERRLAEIGPALSAEAYAAALERLRGRIRSAYDIGDEVAILFAPSGTDLEYVALACAAGRGEGGTHNILLGADEVGSGCIHSAYGRYFAKETALGIATEPARTVPGISEVHLDLVDIPVRDAEGRVRPSAEIADGMAESVRRAIAAGRHSLLHVVHGSKTGLILPSLADLDALQERFGASVTPVIDACQARITAEAIRSYLGRNAIVFVTGSKFMGGPPFSGFALVPAEFARSARPLPDGFATIFRRAEWPENWPGAEILPVGANLGLLMRLEAAVHELERFQQLEPADVSRVILAFHAAIRARILASSEARRVAPYPPGLREEADIHPIEMRSLSTLDLSGLAGGGATFEQAQLWYEQLVDQGIRLGQPVKCVRLDDGRWGATLRIGLSMWQIADRAAESDESLRAAFEADMERIREALVAVAG